jgi:UrcA family protein
MRKVLIAVAGAASLFAGVSVAQAEAVSTQPVSIARVDYRDTAAVTNLYARIRHAARDVCRSGYVISMNTLKADRACVDETVADAVRRVDRPVLTAMHQQREATIQNARGY